MKNKTLIAAMLMAGDIDSDINMRVTPESCKHIAEDICDECGDDPDAEFKIMVVPDDKDGEFNVFTRTMDAIEGPPKPYNPL